MPNLYMMCGPAASKKTQFAEKTFDAHDYYLISFDLIRNKITGVLEAGCELSPEGYAFLKSEIDVRIQWGIKRQRNVVLDLRNLTVASRKKRLDFFDQTYRKIIYVFPTPDEDLKRMFQRNQHFFPGYVDEINDTTARFEHPSLDEGFDELRPYCGAL